MRLPHCAAGPRPCLIEAVVLIILYYKSLVISLARRLCRCLLGFNLLAAEPIDDSGVLLEARRRSRKTDLSED